MHLRPDRLRAHAAIAAELMGAVAGLGRPSGAEHVAVALRRASRELAELQAALLAAAAGAERADEDAAMGLTRVASRW